MGYYHSGISPSMYNEIERIVTEILEHPEKYKTKKSIRAYSQQLKELAHVMEHHESQPAILELRESLMEYCKSGSEIRVGSAFIMENLSTLRHLVVQSDDEE